MLKNLKFIYQMIALTIFLFQAFQSLKKYLQYPILFQESLAALETIVKPEVQVCFNDF